ncbi:MAG: hypothetical protein PVH45_02600, partial [Candidatus Omnitrophota bacterium]
MIEFAKKPLTKVIALTVCFLMLWQSAVWANPDFFQRNDLQAQTMSTNPNRIDSFLMMATGYLGRYLAKIESDPSKRNVHDLREGIKEELERLADNGELDEEYREIVEKIIKDLKQPFEHGEFIIDFGKYKIRYYNPGSNRIDYPGKTALAERDPINSYDVLGKDKEGEKIGNYVYRQILVKKALPPPSGDVPAEKKDAPPAGQIARGNPLDLYEALVSRDEPTRTFRYSDTHFRITAAKTLRQLIEKIDLPAGEKSIIKTAISEFLRSDLVEIDSIVLVDPFSNIGVNGWLLGFNTNEPEGGDKNTGTASKLNGFLRDKYKKTIAFSAQLLDLIRDDGPLLYEYLFHEIACPYLGHERARAIQEKLFSQNYDDLTSATGESGHIDGDLTLVIRRIISEHTEAMLAKEAEELKKTDFRGRGPVAAGEYYGRYNRWKERVKSLVSPAWLEFRKERRKRIIEFFLQRVERRFKYVQMKTKWIWDLEGLWTKVRLALNEKLVEEARSFAKELKAAHDEFMKTNPDAELLFAGDPS